MCCFGACKVGSPLTLRTNTLSKNLETKAANNRKSDLVEILAKKYNRGRLTTIGNNRGFRVRGKHQPRIASARGAPKHGALR